MSFFKDIFVTLFTVITPFGGSDAPAPPPISHNPPSVTVNIEEDTVPTTTPTTSTADDIVETSDESEEIETSRYTPKPKSPKNSDEKPPMVVSGLDRKPLLQDDGNATPTSNSTAPQHIDNAIPISTQTSQSFTSPAGTTSQYHLFANNIDWSKPVNVIVRLHGDGGTNSVKEFDDYHNGLLSAVAPDASQKNAIVLAPKSPDRTGAITWWEESKRNDEWLTSLIKDKLLSNPSIDTSRFYWTGYSGGGEFLSYHYIAQHPELMTGGVLFCAGGGSSADKESLVASSSVKRDLPLSWRVGSLDDGTHAYDGYDALSSTSWGYEAYKRQGFTNAERIVIPGKDHYTIDQREMINETLLKWMD